MVNINAREMEVAPLNTDQMDNLLQAEKTINKDTKSGEIYLLAVQRSHRS